MDGLGRVFNVLPTGDAAFVSMAGCSAITFVCVGGNAETFTLNEAIGSSSAQALATLSRYDKNTGAVGATAWVRDNAPTSGSVVTTTTAHPVAVFTVHESELSDGFTHLRVSSSSTGTVVAITHDLKVARTPANLPVLTA